MAGNSDIFNLSVSQEDLQGADSANSSGGVLYKLNAKDGKNNVASSLIKFIPDIHNPSKLWVNKWTVWLANPITEEKRMIDCPSSIKQPSILQDCFFELRKSPNATEQDLQRYFKRKEVYFSLCDIIRDQQHPDEEGKIKVFQYGIKIFDKIKQLMFPDDDMTEKNIPFDLFKGRPLHLKVKLVQEFNNFDDSQFAPKAQPIAFAKFDEKGLAIRNAENMVARTLVKPSPENYEMIQEYLKANTPCSLSDYAFKEWDSATWEYVTEAISSIIPNERLVARLFKKYNVIGQQISVSAMPQEKSFKKAGARTPKIEMEDDEPITPLYDEDEIDASLMASSRPSKMATPPQKQSKKPVAQMIDIDDDDDISLGIDDDDDTYDDSYDNL